MTIKELSYLLLDQVNGGLPSDDGKINYRVAKAYIKTAVAYYLKRKIFEEANNSEEYYTSESNATTKTVPVKLDPETGLNYIELLGESIDLGGMRSYSISSANPLSRWSIRFVPITQNEVFTQSVLPNVPDVIQFFKKGDRLYFRGITNEEELSLTQRSLLPSNDEDDIPEDIGVLALEHAYKLVYPEIALRSDRANDGVPEEN